MVLFKLASKAFKHFVLAILKAFHVLTVLYALFQFSIDFAFCLRCLCKTTINHSNNSNILKDESIGGSSGSSNRSSSTTISLWNVLKLHHFVRSFVSLFTYRLFFLSSRNRSSYSTKLYNRKILTFKKNKWHTKFAAENNFCGAIRSLFRCKHLNNKNIALVIFNGSKLNANRKKRNLKKKKNEPFSVTTTSPFRWYDCEFLLFICCSLASWPLTELTLIEWEIKSRVSISSPSILFVFYCVGLKKIPNFHKRLYRISDYVTLLLYHPIVFYDAFGTCDALLGS